MTPWRAGGLGPGGAGRRGAVGLRAAAALGECPSARGRRRQTERARRPAPRSCVGAAAARSGGGSGGPPASPPGLGGPAAIGHPAGRASETRPALVAPAGG